MRNNPSTSRRSTTKHGKRTHPQQPLESNFEQSLKLYGSTSKRRKRTYPEQPFQSNFERLPTDILKSIFTRLSFADLIRVTAVSSFLKSSVEAFDDFSRFLKSPWFIFPPNEGERGSCLILNVEENNFYRLKKRTSDVFSKFPLTGSSQSLSSKFSEIEELDPGHYTVIFTNKWTARKADYQIRQCLVKTALLTADPTHSKDFGVALISDDEKRLGYYRNGSHTWWTELTAGTYTNVLCSKSKLYALCFLGSTTIVDSWEFNGNCHGLHFKKRTPLSFPPKISRVFLVGSEGDILLAGCEYSAETLFRVFKLDFERRKWVEVNSFGDRSIFYLSRNQSILVSTKDLQACRGNSIYFITWSLKGCIIIKMYELRDGNKSSVRFESKNMRLENSPWWIVVPSSSQSNA
ncbi:hypothetical protein SLEP1_g734 [Rubroshorea leprosula]|uniref:F-box domain-containing protein n=1 Tax=Rubroshorea leprosula TaxID=152421 RepID=A0AAV5HIH2_9ROSI|nr:hypothetical protein SLEP1_g734 [Rubroshorea leprosula]